MAAANTNLLARLESEDTEQRREDERMSVDPIPSWEPKDDGEPLWQQCLHDDVRRLIVMPEWPYKNMTWDELHHNRARKAIVEIKKTETLDDGHSTCLICYEVFEDCKQGVWEEKHLAAKLTCRGQHIVGSSCLYEWFRSFSWEGTKYSCPVCRDQLVKQPEYKSRVRIDHVLHEAKKRTLPLWALQYHAAMAAWVPSTFRMLPDELYFVYHFLANRVDLHLPVHEIATWRERARILMQFFIVQLPSYKVIQGCWLDAYGEYEPPESISEWNIETRQRRNRLLLQRLNQLARLYVKTVDDRKSNHCLNFTSSQIRGGALDVHGKDFWIYVVETSLRYTGMLRANKYAAYQGAGQVGMQMAFAKLQKLGLFRFLFKHDKSFDQSTMTIYLRSISLRDMGQLLQQSCIPRLDDFYDSILWAASERISFASSPIVLQSMHLSSTRDDILCASEEIT